jgi:hypothetical protein
VKWLKRIRKHYSIENADDAKNLVLQEEYNEPYNKMMKALSLSLQRELKVITSDFDNISSEILLKLLILIKEVYQLNPSFNCGWKFNLDKI